MIFSFLIDSMGLVVPAAEEGIPPKPVQRKTKRARIEGKSPW
jgi:hypothetical protein